MDYLPFEVCSIITAGMDSQDLVTYRGISKNWLWKVHGLLLRGLVVNSEIRGRNFLQALVFFQGFSNLQVISIKGLDMRTGEINRCLTALAGFPHLKVLNLEIERVEVREGFSLVILGKVFQDVRIIPFIPPNQIQLVKINKSSNPGKILHLESLSAFANTRGIQAYREVFRQETFSNIVSLHLVHRISPASCRELLARMTDSVKDLKINVGRERSGRGDPGPLYLQRLQVIDLFTENSKYPTWLAIPPTAVLIISNPVFLVDVPSVFKLISANNGFPDRFCQSAELQDLVIQDAPNFESFVGVIGALKRRAEDVKNHRRIDGVLVVKIKTLTVPLQAVGQHLKELKTLVDEVMDLETNPISIEVEI